MDNVSTKKMDNKDLERLNSREQLEKTGTQSCEERWVINSPKKLRKLYKYIRVLGYIKTVNTI